MDYESVEVLFGKGSELIKVLQEINEKLGQLTLVLEDRVK